MRSDKLNIIEILIRHLYGHTLTTEVRNCITRVCL